MDATPYGYGVAERKARCYQPDDLLVEGVVVPMDEVDGILPAAQRQIAIAEQHLQAFTDRIHFVGVLAILFAQPQ